ncbi:MAG: response regulator [Stygiobacter sp.]|jgi:DNA-binding response OmpR family regulator
MGKIKIVYAEDSKYISHVVKKNLENAGYEVIHLENGLNVLEIVKELKPALVLLDNMMPMKDGFTVLKELKSNEQTKDIPVIFFTTESDKLKIIESIGVGANDYFVKEPGTIGDLVPRINKLIQKINSIQKL